MRRRLIGGTLGLVLLLTALLVRPSLESESLLAAELRRWENQRTPEGFLVIANSIARGSAKESIERKLGMPLDVDNSGFHSGQVGWIYYRNSNCICTVWFTLFMPNGFRGATIRVLGEGSDG